MSEDRTIRTILAIRGAVGTLSYLIPRATGRAFGIDAKANPQSPYLARLFGIRDVALAAGLMTAPPTARRQWLMIGLGCDAADVLSGVAGTRAGYLSKPTGVMVTAAAVSGIALGALALQQTPEAVA